MTALKIEPGRSPEVVEIDESLDSLQAEVGGMIEVLYPFADEVALICNEEGKLLGMPPNRSLRHPESGSIYDIVCGPMLLCGAPLEKDSFGDLTPEQLDFYQNTYAVPEVFLYTGAGILVMKG